MNKDGFGGIVHAAVVAGDDEGDVVGATEGVLVGGILGIGQRGAIAEVPYPVGDVVGVVDLGEVGEGSGVIDADVLFAEVGYGHGVSGGGEGDSVFATAVAGDDEGYIIGAVGRIEVGGILQGAGGRRHHAEVPVPGGDGVGRGYDGEVGELGGDVSTVIGNGEVSRRLRSNINVVGYRVGTARIGVGHQFHGVPTKGIIGMGGRGGGGGVAIAEAPGIMQDGGVAVKYGLVDKLGLLVDTDILINKSRIGYFVDVDGLGDSIFTVVVCGNDELYIVGSIIAVEVGGILERGVVAVSEVPVPVGNGAGGIDSGEVGEGGGLIFAHIIECEVGLRRGIDGNGLNDRVIAAVVRGSNKGHLIVSGSIVLVRRIGQTGSIAITKIP